MVRFIVSSIRKFDRLLAFDTELKVESPTKIPALIAVANGDRIRLGSYRRLFVAAFSIALIFVPAVMREIPIPSTPTQGVVIKTDI